MINSSPLPYGFGRDPTFLFKLEFLWIPIVLYGLSTLFAVLIFLGFKLKSKARNKKEISS